MIITQIDRAAERPVDAGRGPLVPRAEPRSGTRWRRTVDEGLDPRIAWSLMAGYSVAIATVSGISGAGPASGFAISSTGSSYV